MILNYHMKILVLLVFLAGCGESCNMEACHSACNEYGMYKYEFGSCLCNSTSNRFTYPFDQKEDEDGGTQ